MGPIPIVVSPQNVRVHQIESFNMKIGILGAARLAYTPLSCVCAGGHGHRSAGMDLWKILVLGVLRQGLNCDFDRLVSLANQHMDVRRMLGLGTWRDDTRFELQSVIDNVSRLTPQLLSQIGKVV